MTDSWKIVDSNYLQAQKVINKNKDRENKTQ